MSDIETADVSFLFSQFFLHQPITITHTQNMEVEESTPASETPKAKASATPKKRKAAVKKEENGDDAGGESPTKKSKGMAEKKGIPDRFEDLAPEDRMLMKMKAVSLVFSYELFTNV
jgi:hypothetical protein